jgi:type II secretory pathway component PulF
MNDFPQRLDALQARLDRLADPETHAALMARQAETLRHLEATAAQVNAMAADPARYPSLPMIARQLQILTDAVATLQQAMTVVQQECHDLRQRELLRLWDITGEEPRNEGGE